MNGKRMRPSTIQVSDLRKEFNELYDSLNSKRNVIRKMARVDDFYDTVLGLNELNNVRNDRGGIAPTQRAILTLKKVLKKEQRKTILKKQKLAINQ